MARLTPGEISQRFGLILSGIGQGLSGNTIIRTLSEAGLGLRRSTALQLISQARDYYTQRVRVAGLDYNNPVPADAVSPWPTRVKTGFGHVVEVYMRDIGTGALVSHTYTYNSQTLLTPAEVVQRAMSAYGDQAEAYKQTIMGGMLTNVIEYQPGNL